MTFATKSGARPSFQAVVGLQMLSTARSRGVSQSLSGQYVKSKSDFWLARPSGTAARNS
jgi:hypothetical protein